MIMQISINYARTHIFHTTIFFDRTITEILVDWLDFDQDMAHGHFTKIWHMVILPRYGTWSFYQDMAHGHFTKIWHMVILPRYGTWSFSSSTYS